MNLEFSRREKKLRYEAPWKAIIYFCIAPILIMVIQGLYYIIDKTLALQFATADLANNAWYIEAYTKIKPGHIGPIPIEDMRSYINISTQYASQTYNLLWSFALMIGLGCALNFSIAFGRRDKQKMQEIAGNGFVATILFSLITAFITFFFIFPRFHSLFITSQMGTHYNVITEQLAWEYSYPMLIAAPLMFLSYYFASLIRSEGRTNWTIASILTSVLINTGASIFFMRVCHLGMTGAMLGTVLSWASQTIWGFILVFKFKNSYSRFAFSDFIYIKKSNLVAFIRLGLPNFVASMALVVTSYASTTLVVQIPGQENIGNNISILQQLAASITPWTTLIISVGAGLTQGIRTILAYNYGAKKYNRIWQVLKRTSILLIIWFTLMLVVFIIFGKEMMLLFAFPKQYANKYRWWLVINFMTYPLCAVTYICLALFQGINRAALATFSNSLRALLIYLPLIAIGYYVALATSNPIYYYIITGLNDLICALILVPLLYYFWKKYKKDLVDELSDFDLKYYENITKTSRVSIK